MIRADLPLVRLAELPGGPESAVLCASARLAIGLRRAHGELQMARGASVWRALQSSTPALWLEALSSAALLRGEIPPAGVPGSFLTWAQERSLWEQAIAQDAGAAAELFDREGMALAAMEAASLQRSWRIEVDDPLHTEEYRAFSRWRERVAEACGADGWRTADEAVAWRIECIERGIGGLPERLGLAGFMAPDPLVSRLLVVLEARGVELFRLDFGRGESSPARGAELPDAAAECIAAAQWAAGLRVRNPGARLRIAVADLPARRQLLESALEDALHPDAVGAGWAALQRDYAFAAGAPLAGEPLVDVALRLLQILVHPQRVAQEEFGALLRGNGWSADVTEADARARIEAGLREALPPETSFERLLRAAGRLFADPSAALDAPQLMAHLGTLHESARSLPRRQLPSAWGSAFAERLATLGWPGQRQLLPVEHAAGDELRAAMSGLVALDAVLGRVDAGEALRQLRRQCRDQAFVEPREGAAPVEVCGLGDALGEQVDGLWVMGLNEGAWPPAPRPNPLLPAELQRRSGVQAARADSLALGAQELQGLWCESAAEVVFSWAQREGERPLRRSPLLSTFGCGQRIAPSQGLAFIPPEPLQRLDDSKAPGVGGEERVRGGTALLAAQAACPAWGFYRYRLGAKALPEPVFGLDAKARGALLHGALEEFWRGRALADLTALDEVARHAEIRRVVAHALEQFDRHAAEPLGPRLRGLEERRLQELLAVWLELEAQRAPFRVIACEEAHQLEIEGLPVRVVIDRLDELDDGRLAVIDYKTGRSVSADSWAEERIREPQLPIYAALAFPDRDVAAVALARVTRDEPGFLGVAASDALLPGLKPLDAQRRRYGEEEFPDWEALRTLWAERIRELAREVRDGVAAVVFDDVKTLAYCDVLPLLRLAERQQQFDEGACAPSSDEVRGYPRDPRTALHSGPAPTAQSSALANPASAPLSAKGGDDVTSPAAPEDRRP